jgi:hypothetical protein
VGEVQAAKAPPSSEHWNAVPVTLLKERLAVT